MQIKTDQFAEAAKAALHDTYTRTFLDGMHAKVKERLKSMVSEEIGLNDALIENGIDVFETDLGEFIIQLLDRPPFHIVGPAINIAVAGTGTIINVENEGNIRFNKSSSSSICFPAFQILSYG